MYLRFNNTNKLFSYSPNEEAQLNPTDLCFGNPVLFRRFNLIQKVTVSRIFII